MGHVIVLRDFHLFYQKMLVFVERMDNSHDFTFVLPLVSSMNMANWRVPCFDVAIQVQLTNWGGLRLEHDAEINM